MSIFNLILTAFMTLSLSMSPPSDHTLTVVVDGGSSDAGKIWVALFNSSESYPDKSFLGKSGTVKNGKTTIVFENLPAGTYAASCFHDANNNKTLDKNSLGIPKEKYGFSNNPNSKFGPPSYSKAAFKISGDTKINIHL